MPVTVRIVVTLVENGCGIVLSKSALTGLALMLAEELHFITVGFPRNHSLNTLYTTGSY
ncbi:formate dehydrogenase accessory sulfurtransferase FdhD [Neobacillus sp. PS2-9]|uniref:formate dehydrogenase accessory sulfurtransferase FdhD n=1 Tax=Neobacillus sp. PS2-9 TaxID=3070676 RepID=UPI0027DF6D3B|nr:formate dehydrogenase accessory sulfurtransferase FdhD [Neobacillus sp. PS2-9]WML56041.1 formate dehydrogenase accessory sulfurtransferase FdhD [Neobacillus sp. PS2-9]